MMTMNATVRPSAAQVSMRPKFSMGKSSARAPLRAARRSHVVLAADTVVIGLAADSGCGKSYVSSPFFRALRTHSCYPHVGRVRSFVYLPPLDAISTNIRV
jgi:hypothetical protein